MSRFIFAGLTMAFANACSPASTCGPSTCASGCCDQDGTCQSGFQQSACGASGFACNACGAGQICGGGLCLNPSSGAGGGSASGGGSGGGSPIGGGGSGGGGPIGGGGGGAPVGGGGGGGTAACALLAGPQFSGGCQIHLNAPANCAELDFDTLGYIEFSWSTATTFCEGPHHYQIGGDPPATWTMGNAIDWSLSSGTHNGWWMERNIGGWMRMTRDEIANLTSVNGQYYWAIKSFYGSTSEVRVFTIKQ